MKTDNNVKKLEETVRAERKYKDTVFRMLFNDKGRLLSLYNAINGSRYEDPGELEIVTLENAIYMNVKNDLAFLIDLQLHLYEHQSTVNPNMPLRFLQYISKEYEKLIDMKKLYKSKLVEIPTPKFVVFYNGTEKQPERQVLRLSNAYQNKLGEPQLELQVEVLNINAGYNNEIKGQCKVLEEYMQYVDCVRKEAEHKDLETAVSSAVDKCIRQGILSDFLLANKAEVISMSIFEYDEEAVKKILREEAFEEGAAYGEARGREQGELRLLTLINKMHADNLSAQVPQLSTDAEFLQEMYKKYGV
ncbi:MAG: hypothetical protein E7287_00455 [Lachnospiraceae bacterium]|nr:hypothetical protein [Lachnospiraceae bacterium]